MIEIFDVITELMTPAEVVYTSWRNAANYDQLSITINASQDCTVCIQQSFDKTNIDHTTTIDVSAGVTSHELIDIVCTAIRAQITNGPNIQTTFRLYLAGKKTK